MDKIALEFAKLMNAYGPVVTIVFSLLLINGFFIWRDYKRESRQQQQLDELHKTHLEVIVPLLTECREAVAASKEVIVQNNQLIMSWIARGN